MKRLMLFLSVFLFTSVITNSTTNNEKPKGDTKMILVVYYSRTGNTKRVAEDIANLLGADIERIIDKKNRNGFWGFLIAGKDALSKKITQIEKTEKNPANYDIVIIGTPIWAGSITPAVRTYLLQNKNSLKRIAVFTTAFRDGPEKIVNQIEEIAEKKVINFTGFIEKELKPESKDIYNKKILDFVSSLK